MSDLAAPESLVSAFAAPDPDAAFQALVQSPLRAGLLRFLHARLEEAFEVETLMTVFGRLRLDVENCLQELVEFGVARQVAGPSPRYGAVRPAAPEIGLSC